MFQVVYGEGILFEAGSADASQLQKVTIELAKRLLKENKDSGELTLVKPNNALITYNLNDSEPKLVSKIGNVNNTFPELEAQILQPVKEAIALIAKSESLQRLAVSGSDDVRAIIKKHHAASDNMEFNLERVNAVLTNIHQLQHSNVFNLFSHRAKPNSTNLDREMSALINIRNKTDMRAFFSTMPAPAIKSASGR